MKKNIKLMGAIAAAVLILCLAVGIYFTTTVQTYKFTESGFYPVNGVQYRIEAGDKAVNDSEGMIIKRKEEYEIKTDSLPVYYEDRDAICLMTAMAYYEPIQEYKFIIKKFNFFTDLEGRGGTIIVKSGRNAATVDDGFLYDGKDTYIFLHETELSYGKKKITLSPMSYAVVNYGSWIQIYDKETDKYIYKELGDAEVSAICDKNEKYEINLGTDTVIYGEKEYLLHSVVDMYPSYF